MVTDPYEFIEKLSENYKWEIGELPVKGSIGPVTYLIGYLQK